MKRRFLARFGTVAPASLLLTSPLHTRGLRALARRDQERPGSLPSEAPVKLASYITAEGRHGFGAQSADSSRLCNLARSDVPTLQDALAQWGLDEIRNRSVRASYEVKADTVRWLPPHPAARQDLLRRHQLPRARRRSGAGNARTSLLVPPPA